ncbi:expressed unknown protein [Seminavis robusta]|uniref:CRAL-TRIO domain-containing protein n=1 Tax=Seminavis robusta TaxID=568900 RepID=A0A9N8HDR5_9STRA|nr:expressed unknown protein [Seminavis robusta]|eukprot:Sro475_g150440.1 n/a (817) ;mRNA; f:38135-40724
MTAEVEEDPPSNGETLQEPLLSATNNDTIPTSNNDNDNNNKNITISCCGRRPLLSVNHNVFLNLLLCVMYGISDSLWSGTVIAAYLKKLGHSHNSWVGNVEAANGLAGLLSALPVGYLADKCGRDVVLRWGGGLLCLTAVLHAVLLEWIGTDDDESSRPHVEIFMGCIMALWGIGGGIVMGPSQALFADSVPTGKRSEYFTYLFVCFEVASCLGPLVSIGLFQKLGDDWDLYDLRIIIYVGLALEILNGFLMMFFDDSKALDEPDELQNNEQQQPLLLEEERTTDEEQPTPQSTSSSDNNNNINNTLKRRQAWIPYILFAHSLVFALGSGMTVKFFPLFFKDQVGMSPTQVQIVYLIVPLTLAACSGLGQQLAKRLGRVPTGLLFKSLGVVGLFSMVVFKEYLDQHALLLVPIYVARTALMNASFPLEESILMDFVPKQERARWKSLESISIFGWCGSAALGGWASDHAHDDYTYTFLITACIQVVGIFIWAILLPLVPIHEGEQQSQQQSSSSYQAPTTATNGGAAMMSISSTSPQDTMVDALAQRFPTLTVSDCARFHEEFEGNDLIQKLQEYVEFRNMYKLDDLRDTDGILMDQPLDDAADWKWASDLALQAAKTRPSPLIPGVEGQSMADRVCKLDTLPQMCFAPRHDDGTVVCTVDGGNPIITYLAARLDPDEVSSEIYALCITLYLERISYTHCLDTQGAVLLVDTRIGTGWPNKSVFQAFGFLQVLASTLYKTHPGRVEKFVIYPVPSVGVYAYKMVKGWLPGDVAETIKIIKGKDGVKDQPPKKELLPYVTEEVLERLEETRRAHFVT